MSKFQKLNFNYNKWNDEFYRFKIQPIITITPNPSLSQHLQLLVHFQPYLLTYRYWRISHGHSVLVIFSLCSDDEYMYFGFDGD